MIYVIGDSHSSLFSGEDHIQPQWGYCYIHKNGKIQKLRKITSDFLQKNKHFMSIRSGTQIAYNLIQKHKLFNDIIDEYKITADDYLFFSFGEIDIRHHLTSQHIKRKLTIPEIVEDCVDRYIQFLLYYQNKGFRVGVWGPIPSLNKLVNITIYFNKYLEKKCKEHNIIYKSIYDKLIDDEKHIKTNMYMDITHASYRKCQNIVMKEFEDIIN